MADDPGAFASRVRFSPAVITVQFDGEDHRLVLQVLDPRDEWGSEAQDAD